VPGAVVDVIAQLEQLVDDLASSYATTQPAALLARAGPAGTPLPVRPGEGDELHGHDPLVGR
jgi:hypothetical protein